MGSDVGSDVGSDAGEFLLTAIHSEIAARDAYRAIGERVKNPEGQRVMLAMSEEEERHRNILADRYRAVHGEEYHYDPGRASGPDFTFLEKSTFGHTDALEALRLCLASEIDAIGYYSRALASTADRADKRILRSLVRFEKRHKKMLEREIRRLETKNHWKL
jgi:rubrerythrin